jgi:hypothetical protein
MKLKITAILITPPINRNLHPYSSNNQNNYKIIMINSIQYNNDPKKLSIIIKL